jgi:exopolysaccharide biosynthesis polyprenyl glycosylphosphotransferase
VPTSESRPLDPVLLLLDVIGSAVLAAFLLAGHADPGAPLTALLPLALAISLGWAVGYRIADLLPWKRGTDVPPGLRVAMAGYGITLMISSGVEYATNAPVWGWLTVVAATAQLVVLGGLRVLLVQLTRAVERQRHTRNVLIAGSGPRALYVEEVIGRHPEWNMRIVGFVDRGKLAEGPSVEAHRIYPLDSIRELLRDQVIDEVIIACPRSKLEEMTGVVDAATDAGVPITLLSDLFGDLLPAPRVLRFGTLPALAFAPVYHSPAGLAVKRVIDVVGAAIGLVLGLPVLAAAAAAIKLDSPGPVLFLQTRCTRYGRPFVMPKLRTMVSDAPARRQELAARNEMDGPVFKIKRDPRVTRVGRLLRRYSIDEMPQLWSVLKGDMSLVGPRPPLPDEVASYQTFERRRLSMRPGLTCLWQVSGRNEIGFDDWVRMDLEYIDTWSIWNDVKIMLRTIPAVLSGSGAS